jgi:hypothetical protein
VSTAATRVFATCGNAHENLKTVEDKLGAEMMFRAAEEQSFLFLSGYAGIQLLYLVLFPLLPSYFHVVNYVPLATAALMIGLHMCVVTVHIGQRWNWRWARCMCFWKILGFVLIVDATALALSDPVVEATANEILGVGCIFDLLGGVPDLDGPSIPHPSKMNALFLFHSVYVGLFVLTFRTAAFLLPLGLAAYNTIVLSCYLRFYNGMSGDLRDPSELTENLYVELFLITCIQLFVVVAKKKLENSQRSLYVALEHMRAEAIREKVLRCNVEFEQSWLQSNFVPGGAGGADVQGEVLGSPDVQGECSIHSWNTHLAGNEVPHSLRSAPTILCPTKCPKRASGIKNCGDGSCDEGDCLPSDALVWVESEPLPQPLSQLKPGQRVLCYDNLLGRVTYDAVCEISASEHADSREWVTVFLADGTALQMTTDHPIECYSVQEQNVRVGGMKKKYAHAGELQPGRDGVNVLKVSTVPVKDIERHGPGYAPTDDAGPKQWVNFTLQQPQRHTVFVAQRKGQAVQPMMAVGSTDLSPLAQQQMRDVCVRNTFVDLDSLSGISSRRTASAPPTLPGARVCRDAGKTGWELWKRVTALTKQPKNCHGSMHAGSNLPEEPTQGQLENRTACACPLDSGYDACVCNNENSERCVDTWSCVTPDSSDAMSSALLRNAQNTPVWAPSPPAGFLKTLLGSNSHREYLSTAPSTSAALISAALINSQCSLTPIAAAVSTGPGSQGLELRSDQVQTTTGVMSLGSLSSSGLELRSELLLDTHKDELSSAASNVSLTRGCRRRQRQKQRRKVGIEAEGCQAALTESIFESDEERITPDSAPSMMTLADHV